MKHLVTALFALAMLVSYTGYADDTDAATGAEDAMKGAEATATDTVNEAKPVATYTFPARTDLHKCLDNHPLNHFYFEEKGMTEELSNHFGGTTKTEQEIRQSLMKIVKEKTQLEGSSGAIIAMSLEKSLEDCSKEGKKK